MNKKGQIFSLDLLLAFSLLVLAIGLSINFFEINALNAKEIQNQSELWHAAKTATDMITNESTFKCNLKSTASSPVLRTIDYLPNCISNDIPITKPNLGLSSEYDCLIENLSDPTPTINFSPNNCIDDPTGKPNVASIDRIVVVNTNGTQDITKEEYRDCQNQNPCVLEKAVIRLKVWRR